MKHLHLLVFSKVESNFGIVKAASCNICNISNLGYEKFFVVVNKALHVCMYVCMYVCVTKGTLIVGTSLSRESTSQNNEKFLKFFLFFFLDCQSQFIHRKLERRFHVFHKKLAFKNFAEQRNKIIDWVRGWYETR